MELMIIYLSGVLLILFVTGWKVVDDFVDVNPAFYAAVLIWPIVLPFLTVLFCMEGVYRLGLWSRNLWGKWEK